MFNGDLDYNTPLLTAEQIQKMFESKKIRAKLVEMKGLGHATNFQSYTKTGSTTCTDQIIVQLLYKQELNLNFSTIDYT